MNYGSEPADQVVRYSLEGAEFALRISGTAAKNFFIFAQAVLHDSKKTHGKTHLIRLLKEQKPLKFFTVDKDRMHDFARAAKAHGLLFCPIRDKMDPDHIEIAILQDDASKPTASSISCNWLLWTPAQQNLSTLCSRSVVKPLRKPSASRPRTVR